MPYGPQDTRRRPIGERFPHLFRELFQRIKFIDIERRNAREIRMSRCIQKAMPNELREREFEGFRTFCRYAFEGPGGECIYQMRKAWLVFGQHGAIARHFIAIDFIDEGGEYVFRQRIMRRHARELHQVADDKTDLHFIRQNSFG